MITVSLVGGQPAEVTVQIRELAPAESADTLAVGEVLLLKVPEPFKIVQSPVPKVVEPVKVVWLEQMVWSVPAEIMGGEETVITTVSCWLGHPAEVTVQMKELAPAESADTADDGLVGVVIVGVPLRMVQSPLPFESEAAKVVDVVQIFWSGPAVMIAGVLRVMTTVSRTGGHPAEVTVQMKELAPAESADTADDGLVGVVIVEVPLRVVQSPLPFESEAAKVVDVVQMVWSGPAVMIAGVLRVMIIVSEDSRVGPV